MDLNKLIAGCKKNERKSQHFLYNFYKDKLFALCLKYCRSKEEAQDNLQDSFITIFKKIETYKGKGSFEGWMKRITINKAIDRYKKEPYLEPIDNYQIQEETSIDDDGLKVSLTQMLALVQELPDRYRLVFNLYELDDYSHQEIATILNISQGTSKSNLHRAKVILKNKINALTTSYQNTIANGY